jgi:hypothetical protein
MLSSKMNIRFYKYYRFCLFHFQSFYFLKIYFHILTLVENFWVKYRDRYLNFIILVFLPLFLSTTLCHCSSLINKSQKQLTFNLLELVSKFYYTCIKVVLYNFNTHIRTTEHTLFEEH